MNESSIEPPRLPAPGSGADANQKITAVTSSAIAYTRGTKRQPYAASSSGVTNRLTAAPHVPAPNTPIASPRRFGGKKRATYGVPTANDAPTQPRNSPITRNCQSCVA